MRPVYIRMSAFGPYAGIQELNMENWEQADFI